MRIERACNGFILTSSEINLEGQEADIKEVFDTAGEEEVEKTTIVNMMYSILDWIGYGGSKHDAYRIRITLEDQRGTDNK